MSKRSKFLSVVSIAFIFLVIFFFENIKGYYRFKQYCAKEGGLRVYEPLEKNVGWLADDYDSAQMAAQLMNVAFVRYKDKKSEISYDLRYLGGNPRSKNSFESVISNNLINVQYYWKNINFFIANERNLFKFGYEISDIKSNKLLVHYYMYEYLLYVAPLDSKTTTSCFREGKFVEEAPRWLKKLIRHFKLKGS